MPDIPGHIFAGVAVLLIVVAVLVYLTRPQLPDWHTAEQREHRWPRLAVEDFTESDELEPAEPIGADTLVLVGPGFVHLRCKNARRDGYRPCDECARILAGVA